ncbi:hypothetical protein PRIPAC_96501 [Pristionchus pacificus]|uniref:TGF_BETA_2 domain-containing protein n=1 Tax=Pristionchus pacificus TaxID=54126 RepID=A0A454XNJ2_PRIPA|nr:hypothetical protein PRIPAC_96501 [Pristionchus pacificus]|eukprot:PDM77355.1 hypothetical protein PRIPAC_33085 [Pristionchus pacificus]
MLLALLLLVGAATVAAEGQCAGCNLPLKQEIRKQEVLADLKGKLGFDPSQAKPIPAKVLARAQAIARHSQRLRDDQDDAEVTEAIHVWGSQDEDEETNEVRFHFKTDVKGRAIEKAYLHVYIDTPESKPEERRGVSIMVYETNEDGMKGELIASHHVLTPTHAFAHHKIHLNADALERIAHKSVAILIVEAIDDGVNLVVLPGQIEDSATHPLSLELIVSEKKRVRRTPNFCEEDLPTQPCCVYQTVVKITELGWNRVIAPDSFPLTGCAGSCERAAVNYTMPPALSALQSAVGLSTCCHPTKYESTTMIYVTEDDNIVEKVIENIYVARCGCS